MELDIIKETRAKLIENCNNLLPDKCIFTPIRKTNEKRISEDIYILIQMIANNVPPIMVVLKKVFNISDQSKLTSQQIDQANNSSNQIDSSNNDILTSEEVLFVELEEFKNAISDKFAKEF